MRKVGTDELEIGMYVQELDRPWIETPFLFQGFTINTAEDIEKLKEFCDYVFITEEQHLMRPELARPTDTAANRTVSVKGLPSTPVHYQDQVGVEQELGVARSAHHNLTKEVHALVGSIRIGRDISAREIAKAVEQMIDSIIRNPDAFFWLTMLKKVDSYAYHHAVDSSALAVAFGRHLGFGKEELNDLAIGVLLCDIGNTRLPKSLLRKPGKLSPDDREMIRQHVAHTVDIMKAIPGISETAVEIAYTHHERFNGSGYPRGLKGNEIPIGGRIAAIVDYYDAITSDRPYNPALSSHLAIRRLYERRNVDFQEELVEQFIQTLGVYPTGSLVELSTGEVGVVLSQNRLRALRPKVMLILDKNKVAYGIFPTLDLIAEPRDSEGNIIEILRAVEPNTYGIDPKNYYL
jgi:HD-GYP domain-containing protein (c-di-GMP phosphodiesterase class II)